eukprot:scaffold5591_cov148-Skeletonema_marinoi.AAC.6
MRLAVKEDVLEVRSKAATGFPFNYAGNDDGESATESSGCCIGIEHLLTPACLYGFGMPVESSNPNKNVAGLLTT